jgi:hypothetical protein
MICPLLENVGGAEQRFFVEHPAEQLKTNRHVRACTARN